MGTLSRNRYCLILAGLLIIVVAIKKGTDEETVSYTCQIIFFCFLLPKFRYSVRCSRGALAGSTQTISPPGAYGPTTHPTR